MSLHWRRFIYLTFIAIFLITVPILILYTGGYRYNFLKHKIEQVGVLFLNVKPKTARIWINDNPTSGKRPLRLADLRPNLYSVKVEKDDYHSWQKNLEVKSKTSTLAFDIVLFKQNLPLIIAPNKEINSFALSPQEDRLAYLSSGIIWLKDLKNDRDIPLYQGSSTSANVSFVWSPDAANLLIKEKNVFSILKIAQPKKNLNLNETTKINFSEVKWSAVYNRLYGMANNDLYEIDLEDNSTKRLDSQIRTFAVLDGSLFLTKNVRGETLIYKDSPLVFFDRLSLISALPLADYSLLEKRNNYLSLIEKDGGIFLLNLSNGQQSFLRLQGNFATWGQGTKNDYLYYHNDSEVWIFDPKIKKSYMLDRFDNNLKQISPLKNIPYYLILNNQKISVGELDDRDKRQNIVLFSGQEIKNFTVDKEGENIYFLDKMKGESRLFKLEIQ